MTDPATLSEELLILADKWDAQIQAEFGVGEDYTDWHARELRELVADFEADKPGPYSRGRVIFGERLRALCERGQGNPDG